MTQRSERRQAELEVLAEARAFVNRFGYMSQHHDLRVAVLKLDALGLAEPTQTRTSGMAGVNSHLAAAYMHGAKAKTQTGWLLRRLHAHLTGHGYTTDELVVASGKPHQSISARVNELRDASWIVESGKTRKTRSGQQAAVWTLTEAARAELRTASGWFKQ